MMSHISAERCNHRKVNTLRFPTLSALLQAPITELLEARRYFVLNIGLVNGLLTVQGTPNADSITVDLDGNGKIQVKDAGNAVWNQGNNAVTGIDVSTIGEADTITIDAAIFLPTTLNGGDGNDTIIGGSGPDLIAGGAGEDFLRGGDGKDTILGGADDDVIWGQSGDDELTGGDGNDIIFGEDGDDKLFGGNGADLLDGGDGNDEFSGGAGADRMYGGAGDDYFVNGADGERDVISGDGGNDTAGAGDVGMDSVDAENIN